MQSLELTLHAGAPKYRQPIHVSDKAATLGPILLFVRLGNKNVTLCGPSDSHNMEHWMPSRPPLDGVLESVRIRVV